jgi:hypothetical protein
VISFIPGKKLGRLMLISAGILLHANGALAAKFALDPQMQASDLLSGTVGGRTKIVDASPATPAGGRHASNPDPQQQARQMFLGKPNFAGIADRALTAVPAMIRAGRTLTHECPARAAAAHP